MGAALCTLFRQKPVRVIYFGLDAAGKTTLLYRLKLGEVINTIPTMGFNVESLKFNGIEMDTWDIGTRTKSRVLYRHYMAAVDAVVFVVDSADRERLDEAVDDLFSYIVPTVEEDQVPVLVVANKQDLATVMSPDEIKQAICSRRAIKTPMEVFPTVAVTLDGVDPALEWLTSQLAIRIARNSYFPSATSGFSKAVHYPASFLKSSYLRLAGLFVGSGGDHEVSSGVGET